MARDGGCLGALLFSYLTGCGCRKLFLITLAVGLIFAVLITFSLNFFSFILFKLSRMGVSGEYSAVDELVSTWLRGQASLGGSSTF